ncbi:MAG: uridine kinase [Actinomycetes bacterium]
MPSPSVSAMVAFVRAAPARLGDTRLVLIDGPAGAGKTTLANRIVVALGGEPSRGAGTFDPAAPAPTVPVLHADDMYEGWDGLDALPAVMTDGVLDPLGRGEPGGFGMWDWHEGRRTHLIPVAPRPFVIVEGVGVAFARARAAAAAVLYVDAPVETRLERGIARDGEAMREEWLRWQESEVVHLERSGVRDAADFRLDGAADIPD